MKRSSLIFLVILTNQLASAQVPGFGRCPKVKNVHDFDLNLYLGLWYEVKKYPFIYTLGGKCITADYGLNSNGSVSVFNKQLRNGRDEIIIGHARVVESGVLGISFPSVPFQGEAKYNILDTDYETYSIIFSCSSFLNLVHTKLVWILSRTRFPSDSVVDRALDILRINGLSTSFIASTDNNDCPDEISNEIDNFRY